MLALTVAICLLPFAAILATDVMVETANPDELKAMGVLVKR